MKTLINMKKTSDQFVLTVAAMLSRVEKQKILTFK